MTGSTSSPRSSMRNGYSLVPWDEPRYLTTRSRRVETCSLTRWSSRITQSETYSSSPWRVSCPSPRSPVITAVTPWSLSQRNSRRSSARRIAWLLKPGEQRLDGVEHHPLGADRVDGVAEPDEQPFEVVLAGLLDLAALDDARNRWRACPRSISSSRSKPSEATFLASSSAVSSKLMNTPGLAELGGAAAPGTAWRTGSCRSPARRTPASAAPPAGRRR